MTAEEVVSELKTMAKENIKRIFTSHGAPANQLGVKVEDMKKIKKKIKKDYTLSLELFDTGIPEAQYLAGLIADETKMTRKDLQHWVDHSSWHMVGEYTVPWIAAESKYGWELGLKWIDSKKENIQASGWTTLASLVGIKQDDELDIKELKNLLKRVGKEIHASGNRVRYTMNSFLISVGGYVKELATEAQSIGKSIGIVTVDMGGTACKVPYAPDYIRKMLDKGVRKRKMARC